MIRIKIGKEKGSENKLMIVGNITEEPALEVRLFDYQNRLTD